MTYTAASFHASGGGEAGWVSGCLDGVGPAGGRGVMQGVGGDSSVSHCTQGVTSPGGEGERQREGECGHKSQGQKVRDLSQAPSVCFCDLVHLSL